MGVELADQEQPDAGDSKSNGSQPASADSVGENAADWSDNGNGKRQRCQQQSGFLRLESAELLQVEGQHEAHGKQRQKAQDQD